MEPDIIDCRNYSAEEIIDYFMGLYPSLENPANRRRVYIGVTGNIEERLSRHNAKRNLFCARTASQRVATEVERIAAARGFNIGKVTHGGNGTNSH